MGVPTILVDAAGSDTQASGAGPTTALFGTTNASFAASVVTLPGGTDLSGVAADGTHVLYLLTSTGVRFFKITAVDDAADTVTVTPAPAGTSTNRTWAIGGKRATLTSSSSIFLFTGGGTSGDALPGWIIEMSSGYTETIGQINNYCLGDIVTGPVTLRGVSGAATRPVLTYSAASQAFVPRVKYQVYQDFDLVAAGGATTGFDCVGSNLRWNGVRINGLLP